MIFLTPFITLGLAAKLLNKRANRKIENTKAESQTDFLTYLALDRFNDDKIWSFYFDEFKQDQSCASQGTNR